MSQFKMFTKRHVKGIMTILGIIFLFALWYILFISTSSAVIPDPIKTLSRFFELLTIKDTYEAVGASIGRILISILISLIVGRLLGTIGGLIKPIGYFFRPLVTLLRNLPTAAIILLLVIYFVPKVSPIIITTLVTFPIVYESALQGVNNISNKYINALKLEGLVSTKSYFNVILPLSLPYVFVGLISALGLGMKVEIMAEILTGSTKLKGIGRNIYIASMNVNVIDIFAYSLIIIIFTCLIEYLLHLAKKRAKYN